MTEISVKPLIKLVIERWMRFTCVRVQNAKYEVYNDGKVQFFQPTPKPERLFFHFQLSIRLVEYGVNTNDEKFRFHFG